MTVKILVVLRHENSLKIAADWLRAQGLEPVTVALDPIDLPDGVAPAMAAIEANLASGVAAVVAGTKVYDTVKLDKFDPPARLIDFLELLKSYGLGQAPVCLTNLGILPVSLLTEIKVLDMNVSHVDQDNLKNDGMNNLGPLILQALGRSAR